METKTQCGSAYEYHLKPTSPSNLVVAPLSPSGLEGKAHARHSGDALQIDLVANAKSLEAHSMMFGIQEVMDGSRQGQQGSQGNSQDSMRRMSQITNNVNNARSEIPETECEMHIEEMGVVARSSSYFSGNGAEASGAQKWMTHIGEKVEAIHKLLSANISWASSSTQLPDELEQDLRNCLSGVVEAAAKTSTSEVLNTCAFLHGPTVNQAPENLEKTKSALALLNLRQSQRKVICRLRQQHFAHLATVYEERSRLSDQVGSL